MTSFVRFCNKVIEKGGSNEVVQKKYWDQFSECSEVAAQREKEYGSIEPNFQDAAEILLSNYGLDLNPHQIAQVLIAVKISRNKFQRKKDSTTDVINYYCIEEKLYNDMKKDI